MKAIKVAPQQSESQHANLNELSLRYRLLKAQQDQITKQLEPIHAQLLVAAKDSGGSLQLDDFLVQAISASTERFNLKLCRVSGKVPSAILKRFVTVSKFTRLKVKPFQKSSKAKIAA